MKVDKYCQAGVNQNSGNVWVWSEDWPGCVYCSIGFDVQWLYSCGECGAEYDFDTYEDLCAYAAQCNEHDQHCEACADEWEAEEV